MKSMLGLLLIAFMTPSTFAQSTPSDSNGMGDQTAPKGASGSGSSSISTTNQGDLMSTTTSGGTNTEGSYSSAKARRKHHHYRSTSVRSAPKTLQ